MNPNYETNKLVNEFRSRLIQIALPSAEDWRSLGVVRANDEPKSKLAKAAPKD